MPTWREIKGAYGRGRRALRRAVLEPLLVGRPVLRDTVMHALAARGYLETPGEPQTLDPSLMEALARFQSDAGLKPDGRVGPATLKALAEGSSDRAVQLAVNMERRRWLTREPPATRIERVLAKLGSRPVNILGSSS